MINSFYNLYFPYDETNKENVKKLANLLQKSGYKGLAITFHDIKDSSRKNLKKILQDLEESGLELFTRFHISSLLINKLDSTNPKKNIFAVRRKVINKVCIISIDDKLFDYLTPNDIMKFDLITISSPNFLKIVKLLDKPILFEIILNKSLLKKRWMEQKLYLLRILLEKEKLIISQDPNMEIIFNPSQLAYFIYGLLDISNMSYNVVSTLPMGLLSKCQ